MRSDFLTAGPVMVLYEWLNARVSLAYSTDFKALGRVVNGELVGVVGYTGFNEASIQMHMAGASPNWMTRHFLAEAFRYPFITCGCAVVLAIVPSGNVEALKIDRKLGFEEIATIPGAHPDGALHLLALRKENCKWIRGTYG